MPTPYAPTPKLEVYQALWEPDRDELNREVDDVFRVRHPTAPAKLDWKSSPDKPMAREWLRIRDEVLSYYMRGLRKPSPPLVFQKTPLLCWAAALECWLRATGKQRMTQDALRKKYGTSTGGLDAKTAFPIIARDFGMDYSLIRGQNLRFRFLWEKFRDKGYLYIAYTIGGGFSHAVVVYGIKITRTGDSVLVVMDPSRANWETSLRAMRDAEAVVVAWRR